MIAKIYQWIAIMVAILRGSDPGEDLHTQSGYNSKGINTQLTLEVQGQTPPTADAGAQTTASISTYVLAETSAQLRIAIGRNIGVAF